MENSTEELEMLASMDEVNLCEGKTTLSYAKGQGLRNLNSSMEHFIDALGMWETSISDLSEDEVKEVMSEIKSYDKNFAKIYSLSKTILAKANIRLK